jgi:hypothetical protein
MALTRFAPAGARLALLSLLLLLAAARPSPAHAQAPLPTKLLVATQAAVLKGFPDGIGEGPA